MKNPREVLRSAEGIRKIAKGIKKRAERVLLTPCKTPIALAGTSLKGRQKEKRAEGVHKRMAATHPVAKLASEPAISALITYFATKVFLPGANMKIKQNRENWWKIRAYGGGLVSAYSDIVGWTA